MAAIEELASKLPAGFDVAWTGLSLEEQSAGNQPRIDREYLVFRRIITESRTISAMLLFQDTSSILLKQAVQYLGRNTAVTFSTYAVATNY